MVNVELLFPKIIHNRPFEGLLLLNDGQLVGELGLLETISKLNDSGRIIPTQVVAIHAGKRLQEYGVSGTSDYLGRGNQAKEYEFFIINELLPWLNSINRTPYSPMKTAFAGCSLGGLSAIDIVISNPTWFATAGVFSGSLWWRQKAYDDGYSDSDRIIFNKIAQTTIAKHFRCYLMAGTDDEKNDRNGNGIIDAVDDTLDLFELLASKTNLPHSHLQLDIVQGGQHDTSTWSQKFPEFLVHAFGIT